MPTAALTEPMPDAPAATRRDLVSFATREQRMEYLARSFAHVLRGRVLDVGCDRRHLKRLIPGLDYVGIDVGGEPDLRIDLEASPNLPFEDRSFDVVVCSEVLEHLDNLHDVFAELVRVSRRRVLVSLPNCWTAARRPVQRGKGAIGHYGLPLARPQDRHKWFFSLSEAAEFARGKAREHDLAIAEMRVTEKPRTALVRALRHVAHPRRERYDNLYAHTLWVVFERRDP